ncbi:MAG: hypothetical protein ACREP5_12225, partial [Candidatus Binatia bacterium]
TARVAALAVIAPGIMIRYTERLLDRRERLRMVARFCMVGEIFGGGGRVPLGYQPDESFGPECCGQTARFHSQPHIRFAMS